MPIARPVTTEVADRITWLPVETAETSAAEANCPTIRRSVPPYMAWRSKARSTGVANGSSGFKMGPSVKRRPGVFCGPAGFLRRQ